MKKDIQTKREREKQMVTQMIALYCKKNHSACLQGDREASRSSESVEQDFCTEGKTGSYMRLQEKL